ncbi:MAG: polysaccharide deacetylase family protein, partial [Stenotrophomonas nitritireducens]|nr:polysaccharide deacetylase family protein [Stenotrophomonas nitritireducens]
MSSWDMTATGTLHRTPRHPWRWVGWLLLSQALVALAWWWLGWKAGLPLLLASHALFVVPVFLPNSRFYAPVLSSLPGPAVWLTIDDGPSDDTLAILDLLDRHDARATFFMVGKGAQEMPAMVKLVAAEGHTIGHHTWSHRYLARIGFAAAKEEIDRGIDAENAALAGVPSRTRT